MITNSRRKKKINIKALLAIGSAVVFVFAIIVYYVNSYITTEREYAVYSSMDEPMLPVIYAEVEGHIINEMHGYKQEMGNEAAADSITPLPEDRHLNIVIDNSHKMDIVGISYEIRSLDLSHFIEKTEVADFKKNDSIIYTELPIQNLIYDNEKYLLKIVLRTGAEEINYYTRICKVKDSHAGEMLDTALGFTRKTFNYNEARELATYLESDPKEKNDDLSRVSIGSNFSQLTWANSGMQLDSEPKATIKEFDGIMYAVEVKYDTRTESESGNEERYFNTDEFTRRYSQDRIYMMNYQRSTAQIFEGSKHHFAGQRINLGITAGENIDTKTSENGRFISFRDNRELWLYDQDEKKAVDIFSFRSRNDKIRANYDRHGIKILDISDDGQVDFVVYGYMNRGRHEGYNGVVYYNYSSSNDTLTEGVFIPVAKCFEKIWEEIDELCVKTGSEMLYLKQNGEIIAIDLSSLETVDVVSNLVKGQYLSNKDQSRIAWKTARTDDRDSVKILDVTTGLANTITSPDGEGIKLIGFNNNDLIYGLYSTGDEWQIHGKNKDMPLKELLVSDDALNTVKQYHQVGAYISDVSMNGNRIQFSLYKKESDGGYRQTGTDTIVCRENTDNEENRKQVSVSDVKKKIYHITLDKAVKSTKNLKVKSPDNISYENAGNIEISGKKGAWNQRYYAYANGTLLGSYTDFREALQACYPEMGWVRDDNSVLLYNRTDKGSFKTIVEPKEASAQMIMEYENYTDGDSISNGIILLKAMGLEYDKLLHYVYKDHPVMLVLNNGGYCFIYGYDNKTIKLYYPAINKNEESRTEKLERQEAEAFFDENGRDFICFADYRN